MILVPDSIVSLEIPLPSSPEKPAILDSLQLSCSNDPHILRASLLHRVHSIRSAHHAEAAGVNAIRDSHWPKPCSSVFAGKQSKPQAPSPSVPPSQQPIPPTFSPSPPPSRLSQQSIQISPQRTSTVSTSTGLATAESPSLASSQPVPVPTFPISPPPSPPFPQPPQTSAVLCDEQQTPALPTSPAFAI